MLFSRRQNEIVGPEDALPGRDRPAFGVPARHAVLATPLQPPFPEGVKAAVFALGAHPHARPAGGDAARPGADGSANCDYAVLEEQVSLLCR